MNEINDKKDKNRLAYQKKLKDPAFLFYSKDFYEGTRMMLPEERACLIDLMIYQHQNGIIPNDPRRLVLYCSGVDEATLIATLKAKFKLTDKGWVNNKMEEVLTYRKEFADKQSVNGQVGQFFKKAKKVLKAKQYNQLRDHLTQFSNNEKLQIIEKYEAIHVGSLEAMLEAMLKHLANANANANANVNEDIEKGVQGEKQKIEDLTIAFPFDSDNFKSFWNNWKEYKKAEHGFKYKSQQSEQSALISLNKLAGGNEEIAIKIIMQSMENGWKGFFELKNFKSNGSKNTASLNERLRTADAIIDQMYGR